MTTTQQRIATQLKESFENASSFDVVDQSEFTGKVKIFMSVVSHDCKSRLNNEFEVGPRGGLKVVKQEFDSRY